MSLMPDLLLLTLILLDLQLKLKSAPLSCKLLSQLSECPLSTAESLQQHPALSRAQELSMLRDKVLDAKSSILQLPLSDCQVLLHVLGDERCLIKDV